MTQYMLSIYMPEGPPPPAEFLDPIMERLGEWNTELREAGAWVFSAGLHPPSTATVVRVKDGDLLTTDGPFAEGKEHVGGFTIIDVEDLDEALRRGRELTRILGLPIEVRPLEFGSGCQT
jgi:hypothetical protein